jgi:hypothetical protein
MNHSPDAEELPLGQRCESRWDGPPRGKKFGVIGCETAGVLPVRGFRDSGIISLLDRFTRSSLIWALIAYAIAFLVRAKLIDEKSPINEA